MKIKLILSLIICFFLSSNFVLAGNLKTDGQEQIKTLGTVSGLVDSESKGVPQSPQQLIAYIISISLGFIGMIFFLFSLYAGFLWMTAHGNPTQVETAINILKTSIGGIAVIFASYLITREVINFIFK